MSPAHAGILLLAIVLAATPAFADSLPQEYEYCTGKKVGDSCTTDDHVRGECKETSWSGAGPACLPGQTCPPHKSYMILVCEPKPPLFDKVPVDTLIVSFGVSFVMVGTGLILVLRRRKRSAS